MQHLNRNIFTVLLIFTVNSLPMLAEAGDSINPPTKMQTAPITAGEQQNLDMVLQWWREVIEAHHTELAEKYQAEDYIRHNPNIPTGRAAFVKVFSSVPPINPIPEHLLQPPVVKGAKGDFVWLIFEAEARDPHDPSKTYHYNSFDILRIQNGKIQEHWDSSKKFSGSPVFVPSTTPAPSTWNTGRLSVGEQRNIGVANEEFKDMLQYGHLELADQTMDPGYIQHNPNVPQGREGFKRFMGHLTGGRSEEIKPEWKFGPVLTLADGPYVLMMWNVSDKDPADSTKTYIRNHFDVLRIEDGLEKEHWDESRIERTAVTVDATALTAYPGAYALTPKVILVVTLEDGHLEAQATGQSKFPLDAESDTVFFPQNSDVEIEFVKDKEGKVTALVLHQGGKDLKAPKQ
jgi:predicted SnoaL-like aldol condensation-catalyzing enzyme